MKASCSRLERTPSGPPTPLTAGLTQGIKSALDERISMKPPALTWPGHRHEPPRNTMHAHVQHTLDRQGSGFNYQLFELP